MTHSGDISSRVISGELGALATHLGINVNDSAKLSLVKFLCVLHDISVFEYNGKNYYVGAKDIRMSHDAVIEYGGAYWKVSVKYLAKITGLRSETAKLSGDWTAFIGGVFEYFGDDVFGFYIKCGGENIKMEHFVYKCLNP